MRRIGVSRIRVTVTAVTLASTSPLPRRRTMAAGAASVRRGTRFHHLFLSRFSVKTKLLVGFFCLLAPLLVFAGFFVRSQIDVTRLHLHASRNLLMALAGTVLAVSFGSLMMYTVASRTAGAV